jgi:hypothetical protein
VSDARQPSQDIEKTFHVLLRGYYFWYFVYVLLGTTSIALPGISATGLFVDSTQRILAGLGALAGVIFSFLRPHENATAYDAAATEAWKVVVSARMGQLSEAAPLLGQAIEKTRLKYGNVPAAPGG